MKIIVNKPFGRQSILISKNLIKISTFLLEHKIKKWIFNRTIDIFKTGSPQVIIRHTYRKEGDHISYLIK